VAAAETIEALASSYEHIRTGLGYCKSPEVYGAFPADPYSHTPAGKGARQPGMTGQVKEEILTRLGELGLRVEEGHIVIRPTLLRDDEWTEGGEFSYTDVAGVSRSLDYPTGSLVLTFCQVPVLVRRGSRTSVTAHLADGTSVPGRDGRLDSSVSASVFRRDGRVRSLEAEVLTPARDV
jgi:hypothetical protein